MQTTNRTGPGAAVIRSVHPGRPLIWLARGWQDLADHPIPSLAYGLIIAALGGAIWIFNAHPYIIAATISGFYLVGPVMTAGLCELSRRRDTGEERSFEESLRALRRNEASLLGLAYRLLVVSAVWMLVSTMLLNIALGSVAPPLAETVWGDLLQHLRPAHLFAYLFLGGVLAAIVFAISVISVPVILARGASANEAILTSLQAFRANLLAMLVWAAIIVSLVAIGFATFLVGMVLIFPLLGHATWQVYRDLVD